MATEQIFTEGELRDWLGPGCTITPAIAKLREKVVWGWLKGPLDMDERPDPVPPEIFAWALELAGIVHENPAAFTGKNFGDTAEQYSLERRDQILDDAAAYGDGDTDGGPPAPRGCFPPARAYPDPVEPVCR